MELKSNQRSPVLADSLVQNSPPPPAYPSGLCRTLSRRKTMGGKFDDVLIGKSWLEDAVLASLPRKKITKDYVPEQAAAAESDSPSYQVWLMKYPSALSSFSQITSHVRGRRVVLFLDYDGTLSPIVTNPDRAFMSGEMRAAVKDASRYFPTAIISGRSRDKVSDFVQLSELYYAGSHGMDIMGPVRRSSPSVDGHSNCIRSTDSQGKEAMFFQPASEFLPMIDEVFSSLVDIAMEFEGSKVESNKFCVSVHYRLVDTKCWSALEELVKELLQAYPRLRLTYGRKVLEIRPNIDWDKGRAVEFLLESLGLTGSGNVFPFYLGDDRTDEDAFKVLRDGNRGYGIVVSNKPKTSQASYSLRDPNEVMCFLKSLVRWRKAAMRRHSSG